MNITAKAISLLALTMAATAQACPDKHEGRPGAAAGHSIQALAERQATRFMRMDSNQDGQLSQDEVTAFHAQQQAKRAEKRAQRFEQADSNGDGSLSKAELIASASDRLQRLDVDGDGQLSRRERHAHRGHHGHPPQARQ